MTDDYGKVEAVLFAAGKSLSLTEIMEHSGILQRRKILNILAKIKEDYDKRGGALRVFEEGEKWTLTVGEKYTPTVRRIMPHTELSKTLMETLAVIAWKAPVLQSKVIAIRTNKAYDHIDELERLAFLNKQKYGRTYIIRLTSKFFDYFDVSNEKEVHDMFKDFQAKDAVKIKYAPAIEVVDLPLPHDIPLQQQILSDDSIKLFEKLGQLEIYNLEKKEESEEQEQERDGKSPSEVPEAETSVPEKEEETPEKKKSDEEFENRWKQFEQKVAEKDEEEEKEQEKAEHEREEQAKLNQNGPVSEQPEEKEAPVEEKKEEAPEAADILAPKHDYDEDEEGDEKKKETLEEKKKKDLSEHILKNFDIGF